MTARPYALGIDLGTGSAKALLLDANGAERQVASVPVQVSRPRPGWAESGPEEWWGAVVTAVRQVTAGVGAQVGAIGLSGQMHGMVLARSDSAPVRPAMLWLDRRAEDSVNVYHALSPTSWSALANPFIPGMAGPMLHWLVHHEPSAIAEADFALQAKDWLRLRLTGHAGSEPSDASGTLLFDVPQGCWAFPVIEALGIPPRLLPPLGRSSALAGGLTGAAAGQLGLSPGTPVAFGAGDTAAALVGTGLVEVGPVQLTVGTGAQVVTLRQGPVADPALRYHLFASALPAQWYALGAVQAAGAAFTWAMNIFSVAWDEAYELLGRSPVGAKGLLFVPHLAGARSPSMDFKAKGAFCELELAHERADIVRAVFEGVAFSIADAALSVPEFGQAETVYLAGGGSTRSQWRQLLCDVLGKRLLVLESPNASPRGAALLGAQAADLFGNVPTTLPVVGEIAPHQRSHELLAEAFSRWRLVADRP